MNQNNINLSIEIMQKMEQILDTDQSVIVISAETVFIDPKILQQVIKEMRVKTKLGDITAADRFFIEILAQGHVYTKV